MQPKKTFSSALFVMLSMLLFSCFISLHAQTDSLQGKSYEELIKLYDDNLYANPSNAKIYASKAFDIAKGENQKENMALAKYNIARAKYGLSDYTGLLDDLDHIIQEASELKNNELLFRSYNLKGNSLSELKRDIEGLDAYTKATQYAKLTKNPINPITVSINIALIKKVHYDYIEAIDILQKNLILLKDISDNNKEKARNERIVLMQLADTYLRIKKPKDAQKFNDLAFQKTSKQASPGIYYWILVNDVIIKYQLKNYQKSIIVAKEAEAYYLKINKTNQLITPYYYIGKNHYQLKEYEESIKYLEKSIQIAIEKQSAFHDQKEAHKFLHLAYTEINKPKKATYHFKKYTELDTENDSINMSVNNKIHKEIDIVPLQEEIDSLGKYTNYLYAASIVLLLALISFFIWFKRKQQQNKQRFQKLLVTIDELEKPKEKIVPETVARESSKPVTDENAVQILKALETFEEKELYLRQDCTLGYVAKKVKTNTSYLSSVINTYKEKSFKSYLTELRINAALIKLKNDDKLRSYTIKAIAEEFGFKRSETFSRAFKSQTGMYPSYYIKNLQNQ